MSVFTSGGEPAYRLAQRKAGTALYGLSVPQLILATTGVVALVLLPAVTQSGVGLAGGMAVMSTCGLLAFVPIGGRPIYQVLPSAAGFVLRRVGGADRWVAPLPILVGSSSGPRSRASPRSGGRGTLPRCLSGLELVAVARPSWGGREKTLAPVGLIRDQRAGTVTAVVGVRGEGFSLLEPPARHRRMSDWAQVLAQFAREASPVSRLGWSLWSAPAPPAEHLEWLDGQMPADDVGEDALQQVAADYRSLVDDAALAVHRHDLRAWITVDPRRFHRRHGRPLDPTEAALSAAKALTDRCEAAGLAVSPPLSPVEIAEAVRVQADPSALVPLGRIRKGLAEHAGLTTVLHVSPLAMETRWDAVRIDGAWHRVFWIAAWPTLTLDPRWLEPLLLAPPCVRTLSVILEPMSLRVSRRRINAEAVSIESQLAMRERHAVRTPVPLQRAHAEIDQREAELHAGHSEYGYLALLSVAGSSLEELDLNCHAILDQAAQCGIIELRPLHARQDLAWACTLPIGRSPDRGLVRGGLA